MKNIMNANLCVFLILIALSCGIAYGTWSWVGATAWCASYPDGWGIAHGSVGWGGMKDGYWGTTATVNGWSQSNSGVVQHSGGGASHVENETAFATSSAGIGGTGTDGNYYADSQTDSFP